MQVYIQGERVRGGGGREGEGEGGGEGEWGRGRGGEGGYELLPSESSCHTTTGGRPNNRTKFPTLSASVKTIIRVRTGLSIVR